MRIAKSGSKRHFYGPQFFRLIFSIALSRRLDAGSGSSGAS
jgi:hypothetical protein